MNPLLMKMEQHHEARHEEEFGSAPWIEIAGDHSSHNSPLQEYNGFAFMSNTHVPLEPLYNRPPMHPSYSTAQPLQPLVMPQWPSQLTNPSVDNGVSPGFPPPRPLALIAPMPIKPPLSRSTSTPAPVLAPPTTRKTLTDQDRRRMCQYHEDHPTVKHTEIGAIFEVGRSTVSKVLRQKAKFLSPDDGSRTPIKRSKGKFPDIERTLSNWAKNHQHQGLPLSDDIIRDKARFFATTVGTPNCHVKVNSPIWLEKFKQKNSLLGAKTRKAADGQEPDRSLNPALKSGSQTSSGMSPISPMFSAGPSPSLRAQQARLPTLASASPRPRRPTFPTVCTDPSFGTTPGSSEPASPRYYQQSIATPALESSIEEMEELPLGIDSAMQQQASQQTNSPAHNNSPITMAPPPNPTLSSSVSPRIGTSSNASSPTTPPSQDEARRALKVLMNFFHHRTAL